MSFGAAFLVVLTISGQAFAWIETAVRSHQAKVSLQPDGTARVDHELVLKIRGGPMKSLEISGIAGPLELLPDATVRRARHGSGSVWPLRLAPTDDGLELQIGAERGIRGGSYRFFFSYQIDLRHHGWIQSVGGGKQVTWVGPRLSTGVDSAKVVFVVPRGAQAPTVSEDEESAVVLLGQVRRGAEHDEIELLRAHVASGEPAVWSILVDDAALATSATEHSDGPTLPALEISSLTSPVGSLPLWKWFLIAGVGLFFAVLAWLKGRAVAVLTRTRDARQRPLFPAPPPLRALLCFVAAAAASYLALEYRPAAAAGSAGVCALLTTYLLSVRRVGARGPGQWQSVDGADRGGLRLPWWVRLFELGSVVGFSLFVAVELGIAVLAFRVLAASNYLAMSLGLAAVAVLPSFLTGRARDLPRGPIEQAEPWRAFLHKALEGQAVGVELWGRRPSGGEPDAALASFDEARVRLTPSRVPSGLKALEVAFDEAAGPHVLPCVVLRLLEDSVAMRLLPAEIPWRRGRTSDERVAILHPTTPQRAQLLRLLRSLLAHLSQQPGGKQGASDRSSASAADLRVAS